MAEGFAGTILSPHGPHTTALGCATSALGSHRPGLVACLNFWESCRVPVEQNPQQADEGRCTRNQTPLPRLQLGFVPREVKGGDGALGCVGFCYTCETDISNPSPLCPAPLSPIPICARPPAGPCAQRLLWERTGTPPKYMQIAPMLLLGEGTRHPPGWRGRLKGTGRSGLV